MKNNLKLIAAFSDLIRNFNNNDTNLLYQQFFKLLHHILDFKFASVFLYDADKNKIEIVAREGKSVDMIEAVEFELGNGFSAWVAKEKRIIVLNNLKRGIHQSNSEIKSFMALPLMIESELTGVINFADDVADSFTEYDEEQLHIIGSMIAGILLKERNYRELHERNEEIERINRELNKTRDIIETANKKALLSAVIVSLNHEINNPLMIITGNLQLMSAYSKDKEVLKRIKVIENQAERIAEVMKQLRKIEEPLLESYVESKEENILNLLK
ncbi:MAG: hypothetical protein CSB55_03165 [Candidatus Cloacimonadota bacterium]|nr:MAG: hypothetical protein CSB55_03165 [Candidatus Cloacimonadota bacterium]